MGMKIIKYVDNDELNKLQTGNASVYAVESTHANKTCASISKETLIEQYPEVFSEGVGKLAGEYHIRIDSSTDPVQHATRRDRVPVALRTKVKETLEDLEKQEIVTPVTSPQTAQQDALEALKRAVADTPVLRYYNLEEEVTLQCDASQFGLGAALLQNGQPVAYAWRAMYDAETRYAQIEKELLAIVFAWERFESYVYGRDVIRVESDHKPSEAIFSKPLN